MADVHTKEQRSFNMSRIKSKDTKPEMLVIVAIGLISIFLLYRVNEMIKKKKTKLQVEVVEELVV